MTTLPFVLEQILTARCEPVYSAQEAQGFSKELQGWYDRLENCAGLAASQIGINKAIAIIRLPGYSLDLINPIIVEQSDPFIFNGEGCMSYPGRHWNVPRFKQIRMDNYAIVPPTTPLPNGLSFKPSDSPNGLVMNSSVWMYQHPLEDTPNLLPIAIQHEVDHILGIVLPYKEGVVEIAVPKPVIAELKVGRNDPCPCGSLKKFKKCCIDKVPVVLSPSL